MKKKYGFVFLGLLLTIFIFSVFFKENSDTVKTDSSKLKVVIRKENIVDKELIEYLASFNGKFSLFEEKESINSTTIAQNNNINVKVNSKSNSFPNNTEMEVKSIKVDKKKVSNSLKEYSKNMILNDVYGVDITFRANGKEQQPKDDVLLTIELPEGLDYSKSNTLVLLHFADDKVEVVGTKPIKSIYDKKYVSFNVSSFSPYAVALADAQYPATLMRDELADSEDYEIVTFKTDLFKYDPIVFNDAGTGDRFMFRPYNSSIEYNITGTTGLNNDSAAFAKMNIVGSNVDTYGMPIFNYGNVTGAMLFDPYTEHAGKTSYSDVDFEFIYNKNTGYYEYRSSLNHAQFNSTTNRIELYADTLAPDKAINYVPSRIDLSSYIVEKHVDVNSVTTNNATGQLISTGRDVDQDGNVTPQIYYPLSIPSIDIKQISFDAYLPQIEEPNIFKICFTTDDENVVDHDVYNDDKCFKLEYDGQGENDTYDLVVDTFSNEYWTGNITGLMISPFEIYDTTNSFDFRMDDISFMSNDGYSTSYAGFYPFAQIENSLDGEGEVFDITNWDTAMNNEPNSEILSSRMIDESLLDVEGEFLRFGYVTTIDYYMNKNKTVTGAQNDASTTEDNIRFEFSGDDDLWVFIDGKLVLDVGGGHGIIDGYIDFTDNKVYVSKGLRVNSYNNMEDVNNAREQQTNIDNNLLNEGKHSLEIYHVERTSNYSNSMIRFNLPQSPSGDVVVSKQAVDENGDSIDTNVDFEFTIEADGNLLNGVQYSIYGDGITNTETRQVTNGTFTLRNNQYAVFPMDPNKEVKITESRTEIPDLEFVSTTINGEEANTLTQTKVNGESLEFGFVNTYKDPSIPEPTFAEVNVSKRVLDEAGNNIATDADFEFTIQIDGNMANGLDYVISGESITDTETRQVSNGIFTLKNNQTATFMVEENKSVIITETSSDIQDFDYVSTLINGQETKTLEQTTNNGDALEFEVVNNYKEKTGEEPDPEPVLGEVVVSKQALNENGENIETTVDFGFTIEVDGSLASGIEYSVSGDGITDTETRQVSNGTFTLKNNQTAVFNIETDSEVRITEISSDISDLEYVSTTINGEENNTLVQTMIDGAKLEFNFINTYKESYEPESDFGEVSISKQVVDENGSNFATDVDFNFNIQIDGNLANGIEYTVSGEGITESETRQISNGIITLKNNQTAKFMVEDNRAVRVTENNSYIQDLEFISTTINGQEINTLEQRSIKDGTIEFNFINNYKTNLGPVLREVVVSKKVVDQNGDNLETDIDFGFTIEIDGELSSGLDYTVSGEGITGSETKQVSNGTFTLKNNQTAKFMVEDYRTVRITEISSDIQDLEYISTTVNGEENNTAIQTITGGNNLEFNFINKYKDNSIEEPNPDFVPYTINYIVKIDPTYDKWHQGTVRLNNAYETSTTSVSERIESADSSVIGAIAESNGDTLIFNGWYKEDSCKDLITKDNTFIPANLSEGDVSYYACFIPTVEVATLIIKTDSPGEQTYLYRIVRTDTGSNAVDLTVAAVNGETVTITNLPVGNYKVTEITNWNNRYSMEQYATPDQYIYLNLDERKEITYTNNTAIDTWITAGTYARNFFGING